MVSCGCECGATLTLDPPVDGSVFTMMQHPKLRSRWCSMYLDANGVVELIRELQRVLAELGRGADGKE